MKIRVTGPLLVLLCIAGPVIAAEGSGAAAPAAASVSDRDAQRIQKLHDRLMITPAQEALWSDVAQIMRSNDAAVDALAKERHDNAATMTAVEDLRSYEAITEAHVNGVKKLLPAFDALYQSLSVEQRANADNVFRGVGVKSHATSHKKAD